jgi:hypothetical protein
MEYFVYRNFKSENLFIKFAMNNGFFISISEPQLKKVISFLLLPTL